MGNGLSDRKADTQELMQIRQEAYEAASQLLAAAHPKKGSILVVGCSTSEVAEQVNVVPQPKAGGSFATAAYHSFAHPAAVEHIRAAAGMDIGDTLIGMHLKEVAVPVRIERRQIGAARVICARTRLKFTGGARAVYDESLL